MRVLVLGAGGFIGQHLMQALSACPGIDVVGTSGHPAAGMRALDACDAQAIGQALQGCDALVNLVTGRTSVIEGNARALAQALGAHAQRAGRALPLVHMSSMAVYEGCDGQVDETTALPPVTRWYARAKQASEVTTAQLAAQGHPVTVLRPGCVWGPGSRLWVARVAQWLQAGRLGDLGSWGDGWTHGVHVNDVCEATRRILLDPPAAGHWQCLNLAAPDSPRWNTWFADLALAIGATPLRRLSPARLILQAYATGPALVLARRLQPHGHWPEPMSPHLLALWRSPLQMRAQRACDLLGARWTPYRVSLTQCAAWWRARSASLQARAMNSGLPIT